MVLRRQIRDKNRDDEVFLDFSTTDFSDASVYEKKELLHQSRLSQIMSIWDKLYNHAQKTVNPYRLGEDINRCHNTIAITASRGAGKTTFLLSVLSQLKAKYGDDILCLNPIDPSLVEMKQHPFINIIAAIQEFVDEKLSKEECYGPSNDVFSIKKEFEYCYRKMLKALPFIDGVGKSHVYDEWDDDEYISAQGMERAEASNNLEKYFHEYVRIVLKLLKKKCIVISFDDIDTDYKKGFEVLESIRKYLTSCQIITFITGDLDLYAKLIRKSSWQCFDLETLKKEIEYANHPIKEFSQVIDQLENQYLVKLLKPELRVKLRSIDEYVQEENIPVFIRLVGREKEDIRTVYAYCADLLGMKQSSAKVKEEIIDFILGLPLRIQIRILSLLNQVEYGGTNMVLEQSERTKFVEGFMSIFWNDINQKSSSARFLMKDLPTYTIEMLKFLLENKALNKCTNFLPESNDLTLNKALLAVGGKFNNLLSKKSYFIFDYWIRVSYVKFVIQKIDRREKEDILSMFLDFTRMDADSGLNKSYGLAQAFCNFYSNYPFDITENVIPGTIFIGNTAPMHLMNLDNVMTSLPMIGSINAQQKDNVFVSIYQLFVVLRETLHIAELGHDRVMTELNKLAQYRNYHEPQYVSHQTTNPQEQPKYNWGEIVFSDDDENASWKWLVQDIWKWSKMNVTVSCQFIDRVFTRFYYTLIHIEQNSDALVGYYGSVGDKFSLFIVALLNSALVEEVIEKHLEGFEYNNIGDVELIYVRNLEKYKEYIADKDKYGYYQYSELLPDSLYDWLQICPLLRAYVNPIILQLMDKKVDSSDSLIKLLKYVRAKTTLEKIDVRQNELINDKNKIKMNIDWLKKYFEYMDISEDMTFASRLMKKNDVSAANLYERISVLKEEKKKFQKELEDMPNSLGLTFRIKFAFAEEQFKAQMAMINSMNFELQSLESKKNELCKEVNSAPKFIQEDYENTKAVCSDSSLLWNFRAFENLNRIPLHRK